MNPKLLLITDHPVLAKLLVQMFLANGIEAALLVHNTIARNIICAAELTDCDLILINIFGDEESAVEICRMLRTGYANPVLVQIHVCDERVLLHTYEAGADDCLVQPMGSELLLLKIQAWLRRSEGKNKPVGLLEAYKFQFDTVRSEVVTPQNDLVRLSLLEARLLYLLMVNSGHIVATNIVIQQVWQDNVLFNGERNLLKALVHRLRYKLEPDPTHPRYIHTVPHQGYSFRLDS